MLAKDIQIIDIDPHQYERVISIIKKPDAGSRDVSTLFVFYNENRVVHAVHSKKGPLENIEFRGPGSLETLSDEHQVKRVICLEVGAIRRLFTGAQARLSYDQTMWEQILACRAAMKSELHSGIHIYPDPFKALPHFPEFLMGPLKWLLPRRLLVLLAVFDGDEIWASLILGVDNGEISLITTTDSLEQIDLAGLSMTEKADKLSRGITEKWRKPSVGFFMERLPFQQLLTHPRPLSTLARLISRRWIFVRPYPQRLKIVIPFAKFLKI